MATHHCYFLVFRAQVGEPIDWETPTGGFVMATEVSKGVPIVDYGEAMQMIERRYHCSHYESLRVMEVFEGEDQYTAQLLHKHYEQSVNEFVEIMEG